jgi:hypothetical protein
MDVSPAHHGVKPVLGWTRVLDLDHGAGAQGSRRDRIVNPENPAVIRLAINDDFDPPWCQALLGGSHRNQRRETTRLGGAQEPAG